MKTGPSPRPEGEPSLLSSGQFLQATLDALAAHIAVLDVQGRIVAVNKAWENFSKQNSGGGESNGIGTNYFAICESFRGHAAADTKKIARGIRSVIAGKRREYSLEYLCPTPKGDLWFNVRVTPLNSGGPTPVVVAHEDITDRKKAYEEVSELITSARCLLWQAEVREIAGSLHWHIDFPHMEAAYKFLPVEIPEGKDFPWGFYLAKHPDELEGLNDVSTNAIRSGQDGYHQEYRLRLASGETRWLYEDVRIQSKGDGRWSLTGVCTDITERKKAQDEMALLITTAQCLLWQGQVVDRDGALIWSLYFPNLEAAKRFLPIKLPHNDDFSWAFFLAKFPEENAVSDALSEDAIRSGKEGYRQEFRVRLASGEVRWLYEDVRIQPQGENRWSLTGVCTDITERKKAEEELLKANEELETRVFERTAELVISHREMNEARKEAEAANLAKSEFLSRMSHELRTPLNAILGFGQVLERQSLSPLQAESVGYILKGGRHLLDLVNEVLDFTTIDSGRIDLVLEQVDIGEAVSDACAMLRPLARDRGIQLDNLVTASDACEVNADQLRLRQVLINLVSNAIKYNFLNGSVEISCSVVEPGRTRIFVHDSGPGIPESELPKLFTPFERLNANTSTTEGTGLGLALSLQLVKAMGGRMGVESVLGEGCTFWFELASAVEPSATMQDQLNSLKFSGDEAIGGRRTILCIEDNLANLKLLEAIFENRPDLRIITALDGRTGLELAEAKRPSAILLDLNLPDFHGLEVLARLRSHSATRNIPVVITSADASGIKPEALPGGGPTAFVTKPIQISDLFTTLDQLLPVRKPSITGGF